MLCNPRWAIFAMVAAIVVCGFMALTLALVTLLPQKYRGEDKADNNCPPVKTCPTCPECSTIASVLMTTKAPAAGLGGKEHIGQKPKYKYPGQALKFQSKYYPTLTEAVLEIGKHHKLNRWAANFGAKDGKLMGDEVYELFHKHHFAGIAVEAADRWRDTLNGNLPAKNISKVIDFVTPQNCEQLMKDADMPEDLDALKMDIDSFDGPATVACIRRYHPKVIFAEVNPWVPPPFGYALHWNDKPGVLPGSTVGDASHNDKGTGASLGWMHAKLSERGYNLIAMRGYHEPGEYGCDAMWIAKEYDVFGDIPRDVIDVWRNWDALAGERYLQEHTRFKTGNTVFITDSRRWLKQWLDSSGLAEPEILRDIWGTLTAHMMKIGVPLRGISVDVYTGKRNAIHGTNVLQ